MTAVILRGFSWVLLGIALTACGGGGGGGKGGGTAPPTYPVGGAITGLQAGKSVALTNNGGDTLTLNASGTFSFSTALAAGAAYKIAVATQPASQTCTVSYGEGAMGAAAVTNVAVSCVSTPGPIDPSAPSVLSAAHKPTLVGVVIDSPVENLHYDGPASLDGATNASGQFNYLPGELITFKVGDIALPPVVGQPVITLFNFAGSNDFNNTVLVNIARFLQSLDSDGNPDNGITISEQAHTAATGHTLDFASASFDADANPIVNAATGHSLIASSTAIAQVQATLENLPKLEPIAGAWTTGTGPNVRAVILFENGWYYGVEGNCEGRPGVEYGSWAFSGSTLTLAVSNNANSGCGLNTGSRTVTLSSGSLALDGATWADISYSAAGLSGLYVAKGFIGRDEFALSLLTDTQYIYLELEGGVAQQVEIGTYAWGGNSNPAATFTPIASLAPASASIIDVQRQEAFLLMNDAGNISMEAAVRPARAATSLPGIWFLDESGEIADTELAYPFLVVPDGKVMYLGNDPLCPGLIRSAAGEIGSFAWDEVSTAFALTMTGDSNGQCGIAADSADVTAAAVTGNLLTFNSDGASIRPSRITHDVLQNGAVGIWKQTSGSGALTLLVAQPAVNTLTIRAIDSNCPQSGTDYAVESLSATVGASNSIAAASASTNYDTPGCGLPTTLGPTYSVVGDTLTIAGVGVFIRQ